MALDIVLFPHCDLHVSLNSAPQLFIKVFARTTAADSMSYTLTDVTSSCSFDLFAPYNAIPNRLNNLVNIDPTTGGVTAISLGTSLIQVRMNNHYIIARIQVHQNILGWWFGNSSISTAKDAAIAHAQPSIYALFSDDATGTDLVGDITGHGYVNLTPGNPPIVEVSAQGRLRGKVEGESTVVGQFLSQTKSIPVKVVDYGRERKILEYVQVPNIHSPEKMHNILFIPEGFRDTQEDRERFDEVVTEVVDEMFSKPRHSPYNLLEGDFNIFKVFQPSLQHGLTCGFQINDQDVPGKLSKGYRIPYDDGPVSTDKNIYTVELLVEKVGLPLRDESRSTAQLKALWASQSLHELVAAKVDDSLVSVWKGQKSLGILEARDTYFGLYLGSRYADRRSGRSDPPVVPPALDNPADTQLPPFIKRMYEWFRPRNPARVLTPDPRRHPPELQAGNRTNYGNTILQYINKLSVQFPPHLNVGKEWMPDPVGTVLKKSRGFIAMICNDGYIGGTNFNNSTITANTLDRDSRLGFLYQNSATEKIMRRNPPNSFSLEIGDIIDTVAHEFGHSFNLADEYETRSGDYPDGGYDDYDNIVGIKTIQLDADYLNNRKIDPDKVKWIDLPRIKLSDRLISASETEGGQIKVTIDKRFIGRWKEAKNQNLQVYLRKIEISKTGKQLPLISADDSQFLVRLDIGTINEVEGTILLGGLELPPPPFPVFPEGTLLYIPLKDDSDKHKFVVEEKVMEKLKATNKSLNKDTDFVTIRDSNHPDGPADTPIDISDFKAPCAPYKLLGVYEGGSNYTGLIYRPSGLCKMRSQSGDKIGSGEFCHVCKYLIVNRVNPAYHGLLDRLHYPKAKKNS